MTLSSPWDPEITSEILLTGRAETRIPCTLVLETAQGQPLPGKPVALITTVTRGHRRWRISGSLEHEVTWLVEKSVELTRGVIYTRDNGQELTSFDCLGTKLRAGAIITIPKGPIFTLE